MKLLDWLRRKPKYMSTRDTGFGRGHFIDIRNIAGDLVVTGTMGTIPEGKNLPLIRKIEAPVALVSQIIKPELNMDFKDLDIKIKQIKTRLSKLKRRSMDYENAKRALIYLNSRKNYPKYKDEFANWKVTTKEKLEKLEEDYQITIDDIKNYEDYIPDEALNEMEKYVNVCKKLSGGYEPHIRIICYSHEAEKAKNSKDPIIIGESPFGNFWFILGAWDKEVELVPKLLEEIK